MVSEFIVLNFPEPPATLKFFFSLKKFESTCSTTGNFSWNSDALFSFPSFVSRFAKYGAGIMVRRTFHAADETL
jgi:hypothetical protein